MFIMEYKLIQPLMKKLPRQTILKRNKYGKLKPAIHHPYTGSHRTNLYFDMVADDFRLLNKPFTPVIK